MNEKQTKKTSKFLSLVLRHKPDTLGITLDEQGWVSVEDLLSAMARNNRPLTREQLEHVVHTNDKQRFSIDESGERIRAKQGHSIEVELGYEAVEPPEFLVHGTSNDMLDLIKQSGLKKMKRHDVHLHEDSELATSVGSRHGKAVVLVIRAKNMHDAGYKFFVTENDVWLTDHVPAEFIEFP